MRLLIAEDDRALGIFLSKGLGTDGHEVRWAGDGQAAIDAFLEEIPDLLILDLNLPRRDGTEVLRYVREIDHELPILILTGRSDVGMRVQCLDWGADDYMVKPFSLQELRARCRALLRRRREGHLVLRHADIELSRLEHTVHKAGHAVEMTNKEFALLEYLMLHRGQCVTRAGLLERVWNMDPGNGTNIVDVYVNYLRRKLGESTAGSVIQTVRGQGYRFAGMAGAIAARHGTEG